MRAEEETRGFEDDHGIGRLSHLAIGRSEKQLPHSSLKRA
jgi:hypothetical protein